MKNKYNNIIYRISDLFYLEQKEYKRTMLKFLLHQNFNYFITLNFFLPGNPFHCHHDPQGWDDLAELKDNAPAPATPALNDCPVTYPMARNAMKKWQARVDRRFLGRNWSKADTDDRLFFIGIPELGRKSERYDNSLHYHLLARVPYEREAFEREADYQWKRICPSGQAHCQLIGGTYEDRYRTRNYATKHLSLGEDNFILSTEFQAR